LQVLSLAHPGPIVFHPGGADADILSQDVADLHAYGKAFATRWITIHDTATDGLQAYDANALAKGRGGTPFKRPENGQFRPGSSFGEFFFTETGDTNLLTEAGSAHGGFGALFRLSQAGPASDQGVLRLFYLGDAAHSGLDNLTFWGEHQLVAVEDAGDTLHAQRNALDSAYLFDTREDYSHPMAWPLRVLALGRDASSTVDAGLLTAGHGYQNEGDNEITGIHVSDGDPSVRGLIGTHIPKPFHEGWRVFYTQQHGDNLTFEVLSTHHEFDDRDLR